MEFVLVKLRVNLFALSQVTIFASSLLAMETISNGGRYSYGKRIYLYHQQTVKIESG